MKQEIVIKVQMNCDKCRTKAMEVVASSYGVDSVSLTGEDKDQLVVVGDGVDSVHLASVLRKKVGRADIIKLGEPKKNEKKDNEKEKKDGSEKDGKKDGNDGKNVQKYQQNEPKIEYVYQWYPSQPPPPPPVIMYESSSYSNPNCLIM